MDGIVTFNGLPVNAQHELTGALAEGGATVILSENRDHLKHLTQALVRPAPEIFFRGRPLQKRDLRQFGIYGRAPLRPESLTVREVLQAILTGLSFSAETLNDPLIRRLVGAELTPKRVADLTTVQTRRLKLALAIMGHPTVLWLDGLFDGLNAQETALLRADVQAISQRPQTTTVVLSDRLDLDLLLGAEIILFTEAGKPLFLNPEQVWRQSPPVHYLQVTPETAARAAYVLEELDFGPWEMPTPDIFLFRDLKPAPEDLMRELVKAGVDIQVFNSERESFVSILRRLATEADHV